MNNLVKDDKTDMESRFLLIKQWGHGLWSDMEDVQSKLLLAEITNRQPVVFWGEGSLYSIGGNGDSFGQYFLPVSDYTFGDVVSSQLTYYPPIWNSSNVLQTDPHRFSRAYRDIPGFISCRANVLVSDVHNFACEIMPWIKEGHPAYGLTEDDVHRYIHDKYIKLRQDIVAEIDEFYHARMEPGPIAAVHIRGGSKLNEDPRWREVIPFYPHEIDLYLKANPSARIFFLTDDESILEQFKNRYRDILIYTNCTRKTSNDFELCLKDFPDRRRKGIEVIKDTYLACKCDYFIGNWSSNVSRTISRLKVWGKDEIKLFIM